MIDSPLVDTESYLFTILNTADIIFSSCFLIEAFMKIVSFGFIFNGKQSYLRDVSNILDFAIVVIGLLDLSLANSFRSARVLRSLRILRPIRIVARSQRL